jgi:peptidoglycan/xylan/chitin deacetylase (PgdA/CDA1 family)
MENGSRADGSFRIEQPGRAVSEKPNSLIAQGNVVGRLAKLSVSTVVAGIDIIVKGLRLGRVPGGCVVINYHSVSGETVPRLRKQLKMLSRMTRPLRAAVGSALEDGARYVAITADDAFCSFTENALPELCERGIPVTVFVPTGYVGRKSAWDDHGGENRVGELVATAEDLRRLAQWDIVDFGSHCVSHPDLPQLSEAEAARELGESKAALEAMVGRKVVALSFPYGSYGARELKLAAEAGYEFYFDSTPQSLSSAVRGGLIGRVSVQPTDWDIEFRLKLLGAYRWVRWASSYKRRLLASRGRN